MLCMGNPFVTLRPTCSPNDVCGQGICQDEHASWRAPTWTSTHSLIVSCWCLASNPILATASDDKLPPSLGTSVSRENMWPLRSTIACEVLPLPQFQNAVRCIFSNSMWRGRASTTFALAFLSSLLALLISIPILTRGRRISRLILWTWSERS